MADVPKPEDCVGAIAVKRITINLGLNPQSQVVGSAHVATDRKQIWVVPGKHVIMKQTNAGGTTYTEIPLGPFGWDYELPDELAA